MMQRMHRPTAVYTAALAAIVAPAQLSAQVDDDKFQEDQADELHEFATKAFERGFPRQARLIWLQLIKLYDADHEGAHKAIGEIRVGTSWNPDPTFRYPTQDTGTSADGARLFKDYEKLQKSLASAHLRQAKKWEKADRTDRAHHHYRMVLRWVKDDKKAQEALEHKPVGGVTGTDLEQVLYERSKMIEAAVNAQTQIEYPAEKIDAKNEALDNAQVAYITLKSEHFTLHGDASQEAELRGALAWAERCLQVCKVAFPWEVPDQAWSGREWAYFASKDTYKQILKANKVPDLEWKLEHSSTSSIGNTAIGATGSPKVLFDACVRNVAQGYAGMRTEGMREGIGHTFVGMMFNNNRLFSVDLKKQQGTAASEEDREYTSPDFDIWKTLNLEMAWKQTGGVPARELPFCKAATLTNEQRIKAWSFTDYMMRRDPELLRAMDALGREMIEKRLERPLDFEATFDEAHDDVTVAQLDKEWEDFWTGASPALKAIQNNTPPLAAVSKGVEVWLEAFNEARKPFTSTPVTWSSNLSTRCHDHAIYLLENKKERGPAAEHRQLVDLGGTHLGSMFAQMAIVETKVKPNQAKKVFEGWMDVPGYRDALVHSFLLSVGIYSEGGILVMNVVSGLGEPRSRNAGYTCYPRRKSTTIPREVQVSTLGPELEALLERHGHGDKKVCGYPLTLHFGRNIQGDRTSYSCTVEVGGETVEGALLLDGGTVRRTTAPGMVTFYPFEPLPSGEGTARWSWKDDRGMQVLNAEFTTR